MRFLPLLFTVFIDSLGFGLVFPIFSPLIVNNEGTFFSSETSAVARGWVFGLLISCFFLGQFFGGPLLGALSDKKGRKKILLMTLVLGCFGYLCAGSAIIWGSIPLLLVGRLLAGISAGNFAIAQSMVADTSGEAEKSKNFGLIGMAWGIGFIIGPYVGGKLSSLFSWCDWSTPFWFASLLCLLNILLLWWRCPETNFAVRNVEVNLWSGISQIKRAFQMPVIKNFFIIMSIHAVGWGFFTEFSPMFLMNRFSFNTEQIGDFYAWVGIWIALCQGLLIRPFLKKFSPTTLLWSSLFLGGVGLLCMLLITKTVMLFAFLPVIVFFEALICTTSITLVSNLAPKDQQGEVLGINNSLQSVAYGLAPLFSGSFVALFPSLAVIIGCLCMMIASVVLFSMKKRLSPVSLSK